MGDVKELAYTVCEISPNDLQLDNEPIGSGFFGYVFRALSRIDHESENNELVAVKMLKVQNAGGETDPEILEQLKEAISEEMQIMSKIGHHENVLKLIGTMKKDDLTCLISEFCDFGSLDKFLCSRKGNFVDEIQRYSWIRRPTVYKAEITENWATLYEQRRYKEILTTSDLLCFAYQIANGMEFMHRKEVMHRDLALRNILLTSNYEVKIGDFGLSRRTIGGEYQKCKNPPLPFKRTAPEALRNKSVPIESDLYTFGILLWELFTLGREPFEKFHTPKDILSFVYEGKIMERPPFAPFEIYHFMKSLWKIEPKLRPSLKECKRHIMEQLQRACPPLASRFKVVGAIEEPDKNAPYLEAPSIKKHDYGAIGRERVSRISLSDDEETEYDLGNVQHSLKTRYLKKFKIVYPFSLPFTFDIENTWVSLALKGYWNHSPETEDHPKLIEKAFEKDLDNPESEVKILIIEGDPATGKTSLMRKLAYEWAKGEQGLQHYDLVVYGEFREVREQTFKSITDLVLECSKKYFSDRKNLLDNHSYENLKKLMNDEQFCEKRKILLLLDGYDESSLNKQCTELNAYLSAKTIDDTPLFNIVITTRKGYLSNLKGREGRFLFAEVLGFTTDEQKKKYISNHFVSQEIDNEEKIAAVHTLLRSNQNLKKLADIPLFLTFICLVHERIVDGTLLELYCNIIRWLIDRHQQDFPDRDIPCSFGFQNGSDDKFETIQDHYLLFPQLQCLGKMALHNLEKDIFECSENEKFNLQPIIEQVGLLRKEKKYNYSFKLITSFHFPHRTIQEFLAAYYCLCSNDPTSEWLLQNAQLYMRASQRYSQSQIMTEFDMFLLRIALSASLPLNKEKRKSYFENIQDVNLEISSDAFSTTAGLNNSTLNWFLKQCSNIQNITMQGNKILINTSIHDEKTVSFNISNPTLIFCDLMKLRSLKFLNCTFGVNSQLSITNCPLLKNLKFSECIIRNTIVSTVTLSAIGTVEFFRCTFEADSQLSIQNCPSLKNLKFSECTIKSTNLDIATLLTIAISEFYRCKFEANSQLSLTGCPSLKILKFSQCEMESSTKLSIGALLAIDTVIFYETTIDMASWQSITDAVKENSVKCLKLLFRSDFNKEFLFHLQTCKNLEKMEITMRNCKIHYNDLISFSELMSLQSLGFEMCTFEANSHLSITSCSSLNNLQFSECEISSSTNLYIATLPANATVEFYGCDIDITTWQSITDQIQNNAIKCLKLSADYLVEETYPGFVHYLQKCECIEKIHVMDVYDSNVRDYILNYYDEEVTENLAKTAQKLLRLKSIILHASGRVKEEIREQIEKAGQERHPEFSTKFAE